MSSAVRKAPTALLGVIAGVTPFTVDSYLPAMPVLAAHLGVGDDAVQLTLAATMAGFAVGYLCVGPLSDRLGRRLPLLAGMALLFAASVACALAADISVFFVARFVQGVGASAATVTALAIARDVHEGRALVRMLGLIALMSSVAPLIAPVVGAALLAMWGWQSIFVVLGIVALVLFGACASSIPETRQPDGADDSTWTRYARLLSDGVFLRLLVLAGLRFTALYTFLQWAPYIFQVRLGVSVPQFGVMFAVMTLGMMVGLQASPRLAVRGVRPVLLLWLSLAIMCTAACGLAAVTLAGLGAWWTVSCLLVFMIGCGVSLPMIQTLALIAHAREAGTAAGLIGATGFGSAALLAPLGQFLPASGVSEPYALAIVIAVTAALGGAIVWGLRARLAAPLAR
ncbi:multidrug effflux MFS transporter [Microbacterium sp. 18062]|uniref:multidrug effflux MFS transporter n=1 Tax=Microbacterium sp. 18062 TaxID=2681410 RepID=UPI001359E4BC|nr:multidrug effflux MFS transporter [Microbacterium sp. 18062]